MLLRYFLFFLLLSSVEVVFGCTKTNNGDNGNHNGNNNGNNGNNGNGNGGEDVLSHKTGGLEELADVPDKPDDKVAESPDDLSCTSKDVESGCCWRSSSAGSEEFKALSGKADDDAMADHFDEYDGPPKGPGVIAAYSEDKLDKEDFAALESCVVCLEDPGAGPLTIDVKNWQTPGTTLEACVTPADTWDPQNCQSVEPGDASVDVEPLSDPFRIVLRAGTFLDETGSVVMMDDLEVSSSSDFTNCQEEPQTTVDPVTDGTTQGPQGDCGAVSCNFDQGTPCQYQTAGSGSSQGWVVTDRPIGNLNTGVRQSAPQSPPFYAGALVPPGGKAVMKSGIVGEGGARAIQFSQYEATTNIRLRACFDGETNCCWESNPHASRADLRWNDQVCEIPPGTQEVWFVAENTGQQHGSCGIDDIRALDANGNPC